MTQKRLYINIDITLVYTELQMEQRVHQIGWYINWLFARQTMGLLDRKVKTAFVRTTAKDLKEEDAVKMLCSQILGMTKAEIP